MKHFYPVLCFLAFGLSLNVCAQNSPYYYWYGKSKINLKPDQTTQFVKFSSKSGAKTFKQNSKSQLSLPDSLIENFSDNAVVIKKNFNSTLDQAIDTDNTIAYSTPILTTGTARLIILPALTVCLKDNHTIQEIMSSYPELSLGKEMGFNTFLLNVNAKSFEKVLATANAINESGTVKWCEPDFTGTIRNNVDPLYADQFYLNNTGQVGGAVGIDINAPEAWITTFGANLKVAVIDAGVENHEDFNGRVLSGFTAEVGGNGAPTVIPGAAKAHGVACAGIIGASTDNGIGIHGIARNVRFVPINIFPLAEPASNPSGAASYANVAIAIDWAWNQGGADVLSNSWGGDPSAPSSAVTDAINRAMTNGRGGKGCPVIFSSGNSYPSWTDVGFPGNVANVITVGACNNWGTAGEIWSYSQRGPSMDVVAPSGLPGLLGDVVTTDRMGAAGYNTGNYMSNFGGTSAACPQVAGVAALILSVNPALTGTQVRSIIQSTATDMGTAGFDNTFGYGRVNASYAVCNAFSTLPITGTDLQCTSSQVYSISTSANLVWSWTAPSIASLAVNGQNATLSRIGSSSGSGFLKTNATGCTAPQGQVNRTIGVGAAPAQAISGYLDLVSWAVPKIEITGVTLPPGQSVSSYTWTVNGTAAGTTTSQFPHLDLNGLNYCNYSYFLVGVKLNTSCGLSPEKTGVINSSTSGCSPFAFALSPNPSTSYVAITMDYNTRNEANDGNSVEILDIILYDQQQNIIKRAKMANGTKQYRLNTSDLKTGIYYIRITDQKNTVTKSLSIVTD